MIPPYSCKHQEIRNKWLAFDPQYRSCTQKSSFSRCKLEKICIQSRHKLTPSALFTDKLFTKENYYQSNLSANLRFLKHFLFQRDSRATMEILHNTLMPTASTQFSSQKFETTTRKTADATPNIWLQAITPVIRCVSPWKPAPELCCG